MRRKHIFLLALSLLMIGCSSSGTSSIEIEFKPGKEIEVNSKIAPCSFIAKIDGEAIETSDDRLTIKHQNKLIECPPKIDTSFLGKQTLLYKYGKQVYKKEIEVVDTTPPIITMKDRYEVEQNNTYFDVLKAGEIIDNYSSKISKGLNGTYDVSKVGEYTVEVVASDESSNTTKKQVIVVVKEKEEKIREVEKVITVPSGNNQPTVSNDTAKPSTNKKGVSRRFLFKDGYDMNTAFESCKNYLNQFNSGECVPVKENGIFKGYEFK